MYRYVFYTQCSEQRPTATKVYKYMRLLFDSGEVAVYGYDIETNI
jgi:hypothetical protein